MTGPNAQPPGSVVYTTDALDRIADMIVREQNVDGDHDPAPELSAFVEHRRGDERSVDRILAERQAERDGRPVGGGGVEQARRERRQRRNP